MVADRRKKLTALGAEVLADGLLELAERVEVVDDLVEHLIATPKENIQRYKEKLAELKRRQYFISWKESAVFAHELEMLLADLESGVDDPRTGVELVAAFYQADSDIFEQCDDSDGNVGTVFQCDAKALFVSYASDCPDKQWLGRLVFDLCRKDDYGVRDTLVDGADQYLPESEIRYLIKRFQAAAESKADDFWRDHWMHCVQSLARQIKDAPLFEQTRLASSGTPTSAACVDIARVHLECGDAQTAHSWLQQVPKDDHHHNQHDQDRLMLEIYGKTGDKDRQKEVAWRIFRRHRSARALFELLSVIGQDQKDGVVAGEVTDILGEKTFSRSNAMFLVETGHLDAAEAYLLNRSDKLDGDFYSGLLPLAEAMEAAGRPLCASIIYRALLDSILRRAYSKAYDHGVSYLKKLDTLAPAVSDWRGFGSHDVYLKHLRSQHARKYSFWPRYEK
ncbi:MAG: hypothetical protein PVH87_10055 [Desulfobacteraceae bacterium]|jgi:hypothetical protein